LKNGKAALVEMSRLTFKDRWTARPATTKKN
jgi:hypothetical protein